VSFAHPFDPQGEPSLRTRFLERSWRVPGEANQGWNVSGESRQSLVLAWRAESVSMIEVQAGQNLLLLRINAMVARTREVKQVCIII